MSYYKVFHRTCISNRNEKADIHANKPVYLRPSILELSKILMYEFLYDDLRPKYGAKAKLCYMGTDSFMVYIKTYDTYENIVEVVETRFDTSNYILGWKK